MFTVFNIVILFLVFLIAYWWATQGLFSAIIHLLCVVVAGAVAFAVWEPLTVGVLLNGGLWDSYAWGYSLVGVFAVALFGLRLATNKLIPNNVDLPDWANLAIGFPVGTASGVITVGILLISVGHLQTERMFMGFVGHGRSARDGQVKPLQNVWFPVHRITDGFYGMLSVGAFRSSTPMKQYSPDIWQMAGSLGRDSAKEGRGSVSMPPGAMAVLKADHCESRAVVRMSYSRLARDFGVQLTISSSQLRLIAWPRQTVPDEKPLVTHPSRWRQPVRNAPDTTFLFDDITHVVTSVPGAETGQLAIEFPWRSGYTPRFIEVKGTRFALPRTQPVSCGEIESLLGGSISSTSNTSIDRTGGSIDSAITVSNGLPFTANKNQLPSGAQERGGFIYESDSVFPAGRTGLVSRALRIEGIEEPTGTKILKLNISREADNPANIFENSFKQRLGRNTSPVVVDSQGNTYTAIGFIHKRTNGIHVRLSPGRGITSMDDLPSLPSSGRQTLELLFRVTEGVTIVGFKVGDVTVGRCNVLTETG